MSKLGNTAKGAATGAAIGTVIPGIGTGIGALAGGALGLFGGSLFGGGSGEMAPDVLSDNAGLKGLNGDAASLQDPRVQQALQQYAQSGDLKGALANDSDGSIARALSMDPRTGSQMATQQVQDNPLMSGMFGKGGMQDRMYDQEKGLASRGFSMQPEDYEAYGQASDNIARQFGQEDSSLANALASRGLASGPNGAAGVAYSGLAGNKTERLASAQMKIAQDRMEMNRQRLNDVRGQLNETNKLGQNAVNDQYTRNSNGITQRSNTFKDSLNAGIEQQNNANARFWQDQKTAPPSLGQVALGALGTVGGAVLGGPQGAAAGGSIGNSLGSALSRRS